MNTTSFPQLPPIDNFDLLLEVHTHKELRPNFSTDTQWGDNDRLAELGARVLDAVVTYHFFEHRPCIAADEIATRRREYTSPNMLNNWLDSYNLKQKLRVPPDRSDAIYSDLGEMAFYFHTYVGALYITKGLAPIQIWISKLIDPGVNLDNFGVVLQQSSQDGSGSSHQIPISPPQNQNNATAFGSTSHASAVPPYNSQGIPYGTPAPPAMPPPPLPSTPLTGSINLVSLSLVNQTAIQRGFTINYVASQEGLSHQPTWTVRCLINNVERGMGIARSQKLAKEEAARRAWLAMGW